MHRRRAAPEEGIKKTAWKIPDGDTKPQFLTR